MKKMIICLTAAVMAATAVVAFTSAPASASVTRTISTKGVARGTITWNPRSESITVKDTRADGKGVWGQLNAGATNYIACDNRKGKGKSVTCDYSLREGKAVRIHYGWLGRNGFVGTIRSKA